MNLDNKKPGRKPLYVYYIIAAIIIILLNVLLLPAIEGRKVQTTEYSVFLTGVEKGYVKTVEIQDDYIYYVADVSDNQEGYFRTVKVNDPDLVDRLHDANVKFDAAAPQQTSIWISLLAGYILPIAIFILLGRWLSKKMMSSMGGGPGGAMSFGKSNAKVYVKSSTGIKFSDVAGEDEAKDLLTEIVDYLHNPQKYREIGASMPKGALLVGPPGTGKTLLAKAVAGEAEVPFFSISGSEFVEMFVGVGAGRVRDMFKKAKQTAPCIIFIDEIDAVGRQRGTGMGGGHDEREQTLNQLLVEMDGFSGNEGIIVLAATNRADVLDPALLRPGRFDRQVVVGLPDVKGREQILKVHMRKVPVADDVDAMTLARGTPGYSGADLANLVNEAALFAARSNKRTVSMLEFEKAKDKINMGPERRTMIMTDKQKESTAYHEAGHAIVGYLVPEHDPVHKVTIIPRGRALGVTFFLPEGDQISISQKQLESKLSTLYAGRLAEDLIYGEENISTGASNDIKVATNIARNMVTQWGFSDKLGPILYTEDEGEVFLGRSMAKAKHMSDETAHAIDEEVRAIVNRNYARARQILIDNMDILHAMKDALVKYETIEEEQIKQLMNREPVTPPSGWEDNKGMKPTAKTQEEKTESAVNNSEDPEA